MISTPRIPGTTSDSILWSPYSFRQWNQSKGRSEFLVYLIVPRELRTILLGEMTTTLYALLFCWWCLVDNSLQPHGPQPTRLLCPWGSSGKNTGVGSYFLLQSIFPTQGSNSRLRNWEADSLPLSQEGSPVLYAYWFPNFMCVCAHMHIRV